MQEKKLLKTAYPKVESQWSKIIESIGALAFDPSIIFFRGKMTNITNDDIHVHYNTMLHVALGFIICKKKN